MKWNMEFGRWALLNRLPGGTRDHPRAVPFDLEIFQAFHDPQVRRSGFAHPEARVHIRLECNPYGSGDTFSTRTNLHQAIGVGAQKGTRNVKSVLRLPGFFSILCM
jgi:hypothetical protein